METKIGITGKKFLPAAIGLFLFSCLLYSQTLFFLFVWDDYSAIVANPHIRSLRAAISTFYTQATVRATLNRHSKPDEISDTKLFPSEQQQGKFQLPSNNWRPLRTIVHALIYKLNQTEPFYFHLANIIAHGLVVVLLFILLLQLTGHFSASLLGALLFAVHPVNTESVCWAKELEDMMAAGFLLLTFNLFIRFRQHHDGARHGVLIGTIVISYALALSSKLSVVFFPLFLLLWLFNEYHHGAGYSSGGRRTVRESWLDFYRQERSYLWLTAVLWAEVFGALLTRTLVLRRIAQHYYVTGNCWTTWLNMPRIFLRYLHIEIFPYPLYSDYQGWPVYTSPGAPELWVSLIGFILLFGIVSYLLYRRRYLSPWLWFWSALLPFSNLLPMDQMGAERFLYIPTVGTAWLSALLLKRFSTANPAAYRKFILPLTFSVLLLFVVMTLRRSRVWERSLTLFSRIVAQLPDSDWARYNLVNAYIFNDRSADAFREAQVLIKRHPNHPAALQAYGKTLFLTGRCKEGVAILAKLRDHIALNFLGVTAAQNGYMKQAVVCFRLAAKFAPDNLRYHKNLERALKILRAQQQASPHNLYRAHTCSSSGSSEANHPAAR